MLLINSIKEGVMHRLTQYFMLLRVSHWSKAVFVMLGFIYTPVPGYLVPALLAAFAFCLIASAVYIYNDIQDRAEDSLHPYKCNRPIANDNVSVTDAIFLLFLLLLSSLTLGWFISKELAIILTVYLVVNLAYNQVLKLIPILDVACIATGFMLRVLAGTIGIGLAISTWLTVAATLLSLFIAFNKRRLEMQLGLKNSTRRVLKKYSPTILHWCIVTTGLASFITYLSYVIYVHDESFFFMLTLPFAAFALWRFACLSTQDVANDDPVNVFLSDRLSRVNSYCFAALTFVALCR